MNKILLKKIIRKVKRLNFKPRSNLSVMEYWEKRAKQYKMRSIMNIGHSEEEIEQVTNVQKSTIYPYLQQHLLGMEKLILDLGCGPGRFTTDLASIINGKSIGVDPIKYLMDIAPNNENVEYKLMEEGIIPIEDSSVDVVWICLVLGGIIDDNVLTKTVQEIERVKKENGLIFLVENTSEKKDGEYWKFRSIENYKNLFYFVNLNHLSDYYDLDERISILAGR